MTSTKVGYSGGDFDDPTYADIITGKQGTPKRFAWNTTKTKYLSKRFYITFSKSMIRLRRIAKGNDVGTSYRSAAFYRDDAQKAIIENVIDEVNERSVASRIPWSRR